MDNNRGLKCISLRDTRRFEMCYSLLEQGYTHDVYDMSMKELRNELGYDIRIN